MTRTNEQIMRERMRTTLIVVRARCRGEASEVVGGSSWTALSYAELASMLGMTRDQARCVLRRLTQEGLLAKKSHHLPNGGQIENTYLLTDEGHAFLRSPAKFSEGRAVSAGAARVARQS